MNQTYLIFIVNEVSLFYASCAQHLQLLRLILVYEKEVIFVPKSEFFVSKIIDR